MMHADYSKFKECYLTQDVSPGSAFIEFWIKKKTLSRICFKELKKNLYVNRFPLI